MITFKNINLSDSSDDEISEQLLQSVDKKLMNDSLYSKRNEFTTEKEVITRRPSLRQSYHETEQFFQTGLKKAQQQFIAERLSKALDNRLEEVCSHKPNKKHKSTSHKCDDVSGGIVLFSNSSEYLTANGESLSISKQNKKPNKVINDVDEVKLYGTVAVNADWILSGCSTKGWCKSTKGELVRVKCINKNDSGIMKCELIK